MTENERLTFETELGISIDKNEDCPTMSICWNCDIKIKDCKYFNDVVEKLAKYESIGTIEELQALKEKSVAKKVNIQQWIDTKCDCGYEFSKHHGDGYYSIPYEKQTKYCPECGRKLDWD